MFLFIVHVTARIDEVMEYTITLQIRLFKNYFIGSSFEVQLKWRSVVLMVQVGVL